MRLGAAPQTGERTLGLLAVPEAPAIAWAAIEAGAVAGLWIHGLESRLAPGWLADDPATGRCHLRGCDVDHGAFDTRPRKLASPDGLQDRPG